MQRVRPLNILLIVLFAFQSAANGQQVRQGPTATRAPAQTVPTTHAPPQTPATHAPAQATKSEEAAAVERRREAFEIVWRTVKENHFDPTFGGVDWDAVRAEFAPLVARAQSDRELHALLQQMLNRLGQSHFNIIPPESIPSTDEDEAEDDGPDSGDTGAGAIEKRHRRGSLELAER